MFAFTRRGRKSRCRALGDGDGLGGLDGAELDRTPAKDGVELYGLGSDEESNLNHPTETRSMTNSSGCGTVEFSCGGGSSAVPRSVAICKTTSDLGGVGMEVRLPTREESGGRKGRIRMPLRLLYIPRMFRQGSPTEPAEGEERDGGENDRQIVTWNEIREESGSPCSSGVSPTSAPSPHVSPFTIRGFFSRSRERQDEEPRPEDDGGYDDGLQAGRNEEMVEEEQKGLRTISPVMEIAFAKTEAAIPNDDSFFQSVEIEKCGTGRERRATAVKSTIDGRTARERPAPSPAASSEGSKSTIEWGIDVPPTRPSSFESNMSELKNLLVSIKDIGSRSNSHPREEIFAARSVEFADEQPRAPELGLTYTESSASDESTFMGTHMDIDPVESGSDCEDGIDGAAGRRGRNGQSSGRRPRPTRGGGRRGITFSEELLCGGPPSSSGPGFTFRSIFEDPKNVLYECRAPSGPLGIVVDGTPLGPRVRSLNPLSPIFGKISPGDVIVGVDETDTVGLDAGGFWRVVSRKASQQERVLAVLRI